MNENNCINFLSNFISYYSQYKNNLLNYLKDFILEKENIINKINKNLFENAALVFDDYKKEFYKNIVNELNDYKIGHESNYEKILENNNWYFRMDINTDLLLYINLLKEKYDIQYYTEKDTSKDKTFIKLCKNFVELKPIKNYDNWYISRSNDIIFYNENKSYKEIADEIRKIAQKIEEVIK